MYKTTACRHGTMLYNPQDDTVGKCLEVYGEWSEAEPFLFAQIVQSNDVVVEVGANIGSHTVPLAQLASDGRVIAFEPQRHTFQLLCGNLALNDLLNVQAVNAAMSDAPGIADFPVFNPRTDHNFGAVSFYAAADAPCEPVVVETIDRLALDRLDFLKIDVEGYERQVLDGAAAAIAALRPIIFIEYFGHYHADISDDIVTRLAPLDYRCWYYVTPLFNPQNFKGEATNLFPGLWSFDLICVPKEKGYMAGLAKAALIRDFATTDTQAWREATFVRLG